MPSNKTKQKGSSSFSGMWGLFQEGIFSSGDLWVGCGTGIIQLALNVPPTFVFRAAELIWNQNAGKAPIVCLAFFFFFYSSRSGLWFILALIMLHGYKKCMELWHSCRRFIGNICVCLCMHTQGEKVDCKGQNKISIFKKCGLTHWLISLIVQRFTLCWIFF